MSPINNEAERRRFRRQFDDDEWAALTADTEFKKAWEDNDIIKAGEQAMGVVAGTRQEWLVRRRSMKNKQEKERERQTEHQERLKKALRLFDELQERK